ncbi:hypothetical protein QYM36_011422, partial [Artemia franciscana]
MAATGQKQEFRDLEEFITHDTKSADKDDPITTNFLRDLVSINNALSEDLKIEDAHLISNAREQAHIGESFSLRGMEFNHVIVCVLNNSSSFPDRDKLFPKTSNDLIERVWKEYGSLIDINVSDINLVSCLNCFSDDEKCRHLGLVDDLTEAISRAVTSVTVVYTESNILIAEIADRLETCSPEICPDSSYKEKYELEKIFREIERFNFLLLYSVKCNAEVFGMNSNEDLFECSCCGKIQLPGEKETRPFLQAAEQVLLDYIDKSCLFDIDKLVLVPDVIGKIGSQGLNGFEAEYKTIKKQIEIQIGNNKPEIRFKELTLSKLIRFIGGKRPMVQAICSSDSKEVFHVEKYALGTKFKVFCDDVRSCHAELFLGVLSDNQHGLFEIIKAIQQSNFCWITSYSFVPPVKNVYCPLSCLRVNGQEIYDSSRCVHLTDSLRYTGSIHAVLNQLYISSSKYQERISSLDFRPGTRVIGEKPQFICVKDCNTMKAKVQEILHKLDKEGIERNEIAVIRTDKMKNEANFRMEMFKGVMECAKKDDRITPNFLKDLENLMNIVHIGDEDLEIEDAHLISTVHEQTHIGETFSLRGIEFNHVIICVLNNSFSFTDRDKIISETRSLCNRMNKERGSFCPISARIIAEFNGLVFNLNCLFDDQERRHLDLMDDLTEAISRAVTSVTVVYTE